jgi:hypothetical protein
MYSITLYWDCFENNIFENFLLESARAYFDNGDSLTAIVSMISMPSPGAPQHTRYILTVKDNTMTDRRDGQFNVDIRLYAGSAEQVPHRPTDNHPIFHLLNGVKVGEGEISIQQTPSTITVRVTPWRQTPMPRPSSKVTYQKVG